MLQFLGEELFLVFIQLRERNHITSTEVWSKLQKRPPHAKFYNLSTAYMDL